MAFQFEKLEVCQKALDWVEAVELLCESIKGKASYSLIDQLSRTTLSIPLNIAEGNGRWHRRIR
ncbi:MAG: four helix bundle protein [Deltaproteobacteria bacterium]|nr:four helix bundle protein [Deltaproteobacteria bacterium]